MIWGGLREDAAEAAAAFGELGVVFAPEFEFVVAAYGGEELAEEGGEPLDLGEGLVWVLFTWGGHETRI